MTCAHRILSSKSTTFGGRSGRGLACGILLAGFASVAMAQSAARPDWSECLRAKDPEQRVQACTVILSGTRDPKIIVRALNGRGNALCAAAQRCAEAVPDFTSVVKSAPAIGGYHDSLARALRAASRYDEALRESDRAIALAPAATFLFVGKAKTLAAAGRGLEAVAVIEMAMTGTATDAGLLEYEGKLFGDLRRYPESHAAFEHALRLQPTRISIYARRADVEIAEGRTEEAIRDLKSYPADGSEIDQVHSKLAALRMPPTRGMVEASSAAEMPAAGVADPPHAKPDLVRTSDAVQHSAPTPRTDEMPSPDDAKVKQRDFEKKFADSAQALASLEAAAKSEQAGSEKAFDCASSINRRKLYDLVITKNWGEGFDHWAKSRMFSSYRLYAFTTLSKSDGYRACQFTANTIAGPRVYQFVVRASDDRTEQTISGFSSL